MRTVARFIDAGIGVYEVFEHDDRFIATHRDPDFGHPVPIATPTSTRLAAVLAIMHHAGFLIEPTEDPVMREALTFRVLSD